MYINLQYTIDPCPIVGIYGFISDASLDNNTKSMITFSTLIARRLILLKWKDKFPQIFIIELDVPSHNGERFGTPKVAVTIPSYLAASADMYRANGSKVNICSFIVVYLSPTFFLPSI